MKKTLSILSFLLFSFFSLAQIHTPVNWSFEKKELNDKELILVFKAKIEPTWNLYGLEVFENGPVNTKIVFDKLNNVKLKNELKSSIPSKEKFDENFSMHISYFNQDVDFSQTFSIQDKNDYYISGYVEFMVCNDQTCLAPSKEYFSFQGTKKENKKAENKLNLDNNKPEEKQNIKEEGKITEVKKVDTLLIATTSTNINENIDLWAPVINKLKEDENATSKETSYWAWLLIFIKGLLGGFIAIFTPCVWPIIPMTVSFFLKRTQNKRQGRRDAILYGFSIIAIYLFLGILITLIFGANALNSLSTSAFFNLLFFALLVFFGISFLGAFELTLPSSWTTKLDQKAEATSGVLSIFLMAFTLALVSFSCTGPIIGTLLVDVSVSGSILAPAIGMFGFALALSIPFSAFALFPSWLQNVPKSGGWLNSVKVSLGFLELALALKFLSVADLAYGWRILDREVFLVLWIVIFALLGLYLLGKLTFANDSKTESISVGRLSLSIISFSFALYMLPGLWGAPLKAISAFAPPLYTQDFNLYKEEVIPDFHNYEEGMAYAKKTNKPVLIDFSGYGCVNCRKMEANIWSKPEIKQHITQDFVLITLYVDDKTSLDKPYTVIENGKKTEIKTIGDKWSYLQRHKFGANSQPYYIVLDNKGEPLNKPFFFTENPNEFIQFLKTGLKN